MEPDGPPDLPANLRDCGSFRRESTELLIVQGDSAAVAVAAARNRQFQAVLTVGGKPLNSLRASRREVIEFPCYRDMISSLGTGWDTEFDLGKLRYERVVLLFEPDADGIHASLLVLMFFYRWMRPLLESGRVHRVRAPLYAITYDGIDEPICVIAEESRVDELDRLVSQGKTNILIQKFQGLESMGPGTLRRHCVDPTTRKSTPMSVADVEAAIEVFSSEFK